MLKIVLSTKGTPSLLNRRKQSIGGFRNPEGWWGGGGGGVGGGVVVGTSEKDNVFFS